LMADIARRINEITNEGLWDKVNNARYH
jgi:hypothetical protein